MKYLKIVIALLLLTYYSKAQGLQTVIPKGSKVFVIAPGNKAYTKAREMLTKWGYWQIVDNRKDADFTMKINIVKPNGYLMNRNYNATADFIDKSNTSIFTTKEVTVMDRDVAVNALIDKRIKQDRND